jgi:hypothetical protein
MKKTGINLEDSLHELGEVSRFHGLDKKMDMIGHQAIMKKPDPEFFDILSSDF